MNRLNPGPGGRCWPPVSFFRSSSTASISTARNRPIRTSTHPAVPSALGALVLALALAGSGVARAEEAATPPVTAVDQLPSGQEVSNTVIELAGWVVATKDSQGYPFAIMDKAAAQILVF